MTETSVTKRQTKGIKSVPDDNQSTRARAAPSAAFPSDTAKGHRDDEKHNIREQAARTARSLTQNTKAAGGRGGVRSPPITRVA